MADQTTQTEDIIEDFETPPEAEPGGEIDSDAAFPTEQSSDGADGAPDGERANTDGGSDTAPQLTPVEQLAQAMGWSPKDQWRGPETQWKPADQFVKETHSINQHLKQELQQKDKDYQQRFERQEKMAKQALAMQRQHIEHQYDQRLRELAATADVEGYDAARTERDETLRRFDENVIKQQQQPEGNGQQGPVDPAVQQFVARNRDWYGRDPIMTGAANETWGYYQNSFPNIGFDQVAQMVEDDLRKSFPDRFGGTPPNQQQRGQGQQRPGSPQVEGGRMRSIPGASKKKGWDSLPPEAKRAGQQFIEEGVYGSDPKKAKEAYASMYWETA